MPSSTSSSLEPLVRRLTPEEAGQAVRRRADQGWSDRIHKINCGKKSTSSSECQLRNRQPDNPEYPLPQEQGLLSFARYLDASMDGACRPASSCAQGENA